MRRDTIGMNFESYYKRIATLRQPDDERNEKQIAQKRLQVTNTEMKMASVNKVQFAGLNEDVHKAKTQFHTKSRTTFRMELCLCLMDILDCQKFAR